MEHLSDAAQASSLELRQQLQKLEESLTRFSVITSTPVTYFDLRGRPLWELDRENKVCVASDEYADDNSACLKTLLSAFNTAALIGELYLYECNAGLLNACCCLSCNGEVFGYLNAGPIGMGNEDSQVLGKFYHTANLERIDLSLLMEILPHVKIYTPLEATYLYRLLEDILNASGGDICLTKSEAGSDAGSRRESGHREHKDVQKKPDYPLELEQQLIEDITGGEGIYEPSHLARYIEALIAFENGSVSLVKLRIQALLTGLLDRASLGDISPQNISHLDAISMAENLQDVIRAATNTVDYFLHRRAVPSYRGDSTVVHGAIDCMQEHFKEALDLRMIAEVVHVNHTYLSSLFKREMKMSLMEYLKTLRLSYAAEQLVNTTDSITDVALESGFRDASYFAHQFHERYGVTPRQYRDNRNT